MKTNRLSERAMLIHLGAHQWTAKMKDKQKGEDIAVQANAEKDAVDCIINLVSPSELQPINLARSNVDRVFKKFTLPWMDGNTRILPSDMFFTLREELKNPLEVYNSAVRIFAAKYPELVKKAPKRLGKLCTNTSLPSVNEIQRRFRIDMDILPVPEIVDFRVALADDEAEAIKKQVETSIQSLTDRAMRDVWERLSEMIGKIAETMGQKDKKFRNSIITNLKEFCELMPKFNVTSDVNLEAVRKETLAKLAELDPEDLREIPINRKKAAKDAEDLMAKIGQYIK